jgi:cold shock CspA family protein
MSERTIGVVKTILPEKGFGFIRSNGQPQRFFHLKDAYPGITTLDVVTFRLVEESGRKHLRAVEIQPV